MQNTFSDPFKFESLEVWKLGMKIVHEAYAVAAQFPKSELFALSDQLRRASTSVVLNIVEGSAQPTKKGFLVYLNRAKASALECIACIDIAIQEKFLTQKNAVPAKDLLREEYFKLIALARSIDE